MLKKYFTSIWYKPDGLPYKLINYLPKNLQGYLIGEIEKRYFQSIEGNLVEQIPLYELIGQAVKLFSSSQYGRFIYWINERFDKRVSERVERIDFDIFIGYETSSRESFKRCKELGKTVVLDLGAEHYKFQRKICELAGLDFFDGNDRLRERVERIKHEELEIADYIFTPSEYSKKTLLAAGIPEGKIFKIPYGFNPDLFKPKETYRKNATFKVLYVSSITKRKGIQYLLQAFKELNLKDAELIMIGGMADGRDVLKQYEGFYKYIPFLHHEELVRYYQDADIFVFPSLLDSFAMVVIEVMTCGTPVIISENTGAKDVVRDRVDGFIVPIMDVESLKDKTLYFYENRDKVEEFGRNARIQAEQYPWKRYKERVREAVLNI